MDPVTVGGGGGGVGGGGLTERSRPRWGWLLKRILLGLVAAAAVSIILLLLIFADARYVARAGVEEARLLLKRRGIDGLVADSSVPAALRQRLRLVRAARTYAADSLGLAAGRTYTTYVDVGRDTLLLVLSASRKDRLREVTWTFPIVGIVPYKGFFKAAGGRGAPPRISKPRASTCSSVRRGRSRPSGISAIHCSRPQ